MFKRNKSCDVMERNLKGDKNMLREEDFIEKQMKKEKKILKTGDFVYLKILAGGGSDIPVTSLQLAGDYTPYDICMLITAMKEVMKSLKENYSTEYEIVQRSKHSSEVVSKLDCMEIDLDEEV